jgi:hypothetical protein
MNWSNVHRDNAPVIALCRSAAARWKPQLEQEAEAWQKSPTIAP